MGVTVDLTYDMGKALGTTSLELEGASTVKDIVRMTKDHFGEAGGDFEDLSRVAAVAVNGVLISYRKGMKTRLHEGDRVAFVKAAAGG